MKLNCSKASKESKEKSSLKKSSASEVELCAFCLDPKHDPVQLECKHSYCRSCLELYRQARCWQAKRCPLCRCSLAPTQPLQKQQNNWRLKIILLLLLFLLSYGPFYLLLNYW